MVTACRVNDLLKQNKKTKQEVPSQELQINYWEKRFCRCWCKCFVVLKKKNTQGYNNHHARCDLLCNIPFGVAGPGLANQTAQQTLPLVLLQANSRKC